MDSDLNESPNIIEKAGWFLHSQKNRLDFALRQSLRDFTIRPRSASYIELAEDKVGLITEPDLLKEEARLLNQYNLEDFKISSGNMRYLENLAVLHHLEYMLEKSSLITLLQEKSFTRVLDVGSKNWSYVNALHAFFSQGNPNLQLDGIELDAYRRYVDGFCRKDYAESFIRHLPNTQYQAGNIMAVEKPYDVITCFLPFVFEEPCLAWGLPLNHFSPQAFFDHLVDLLTPDGLLFIVNQGEDEYERQQEIINGAHHYNRFTAVAVGKMPATFYPYQHARYGWTITRNQSQ